MTDILRIATRESPLAMWQAHAVQQQLQVHFPELQVELVPMTTQGDIILEKRLSEVGGKGLFVKELEYALLDGRADIAVHSMKDLPTEFPDGLILSAICEREDARDVFVSQSAKNIFDLPANAIIGTSSLRRQSQVLALRADVRLQTLRGNVGTRLAKLDAGQYDAIILAAAGLKRLGLAERISSYFTVEQLLPAAGQGAMGIECRSGDTRVLNYIKPLAHSVTTLCVQAERAVNARLQGGCSLPIAVYATIEQQQMSLSAVIASSDGQQLLRATATDVQQHWQVLADHVANQLFAQGAQDILDQCKH